MTPLYTVEVDNEWRMEFYDDGTAVFVDYYEGFAEISFFGEIWA
jgi:hypothetical protein